MESAAVFFWKYFTGMSLRPIKRVGAVPKAWAVIRKYPAGILLCPKGVDKNKERSKKI
jgi:hypothetical protein